MTENQVETRKDAYVEERKAELAEAERESREAAEAVGRETGEVKSRLEGKLVELDELRRQAAEHVERVVSAAGDAWESLRDEADHTWRALRASVNYFRSYYRRR